MDFHKSLYKSFIISNTTSPKNFVKKNLQYARNKRIELFQQNRIISVSPSPAAIKKNVDNIENGKNLPTKNKENLEIKTSGKLSRQEAYVAKFLAWKKQKENDKNQKPQRKRPFISTCSGNSQSSFVSENHKFKAPENLKSLTKPESYKFKIKNDKIAKNVLEVKSSNLNEIIIVSKKLHSTPNSSQKTNKFANTKAILLKDKNSARKVINDNIDNKTSKKMKMSEKNEIKISKDKVDGNENAIKIKPVVLISNGMRENVSKRKPAPANSNKIREDVIKSKGMSINSNGVRENVIKTKPEALVKSVNPSAPLSNFKTIKKDLIERHKINPCNVAKEFKFVQNNVKKENNAKQIKTNFVEIKKSVNIKSPVKLNKEVSKPYLLKNTPCKNAPYLKRGISSNTNNIKKKANASKPKNSKRQNENEQQEIKPKPIFEKPKMVLLKDNLEIPNNASFITSTLRKNSKDGSSIIPSDLSESMSPIEMEVVEDDIKKSVPLVNLLVDRKSVDIKSKPNEVLATPLENIELSDLNNTPINNIEENDEEKSVYVSPYVTMSRGKVSIKQEKKLRESIYVLNDSHDGIASAEMRRVRETAKYFRKMLNDEIFRLQKYCDDWEQYMKDTDIVLLEECGNDMINVAIGQTKLLINKKFQQFQNLINRCEEFAKIKNELKKTDNENEKPILPEDLEGFWQMMYIQVDNIDERFRKLDRWRSNDWKDPDEIQREEKNKSKSKLLTKISKKKKTTQASAGLKMKLKEMYMAHMANKKQKEEEGNNICIILPPKKSRKSIDIKKVDNIETPIRRSKRLSSASKIINSSEPNNIVTPSRRSLRIESAINAVTKILLNNGTPSRSMSEFRLISLVKTPCIACFGNDRCSPAPRKSILKTPGTQKKKQNVIFNEKLQFQSPNNGYVSEKEKKERLSAGKSLSANSQKQARKRSLNLRARRLIVDPEAQIEIPRK